MIYLPTIQVVQILILINYGQWWSYNLFSDLNKGLIINVGSQGGSLGDKNFLVNGD